VAAYKDALAVSEHCGRPEMRAGVPAVLGVLAACKVFGCKSAIFTSCQRTGAACGPVQQGWLGGQVGTPSWAATLFVWCTAWAVSDRGLTVLSPSPAAGCSQLPNRAQQPGCSTHRPGHNAEGPGAAESRYGLVCSPPCRGSHFVRPCTTQAADVGCYGVCHSAHSLSVAVLCWHRVTLPAIRKSRLLCAGPTEH
jgi:hypothetical protein